jgi:hypothetical protein
MCSCPKGEPPLTISFGIEPVNAVFTGQTVTYEATNCGLPLYSDVILTPNVTWTAIGGDAGPANGTGGSTAVTLSSPTIVNVAFTAWASSAAPPFDAIANCGAIVSAFAIEHTVRPRSGGPPPKDPHRKKLLFGEQVDLEVKGSPFGTITWEFDSPAEDIGSLSPTSGGTTLYTAPAAMPAGGPTVRVKAISTPPEGQGTPVSTTIEFTIVRILITFEALEGNEGLSPNKRKMPPNVKGQPQPDEWMPGHGLRIFPEAISRTDTAERDKVKVVVQTVPGISEAVRLKAFDVDDPTVDPTNLVDFNDEANSQKGCDNWSGGHVGEFESTLSATITLTLDGDGFANTKFVVGTQPGDNYRIAGAFDQESLTPLQVDSSAADSYVAPSETLVSGFNGGFSEMLTVWRKLHLEADSMSLWSGKKPGPDRVAVEIASWDERKRYAPVVTLKYVSTAAEIPPVPPLPNQIDRYASGWLVKNDKKIPILNSTCDTLTLNILPDPTISAETKALFTGTVEVYDDDDYPQRRVDSREENVRPLPLTSLVNSNLKSKFGRAYVEVEEIQDNTTKTISFGLNRHAGNPFTDLVDSQDWSGTDRFGYWYHFLIAAYQPQRSADKDPDTEETAGVQLGATTEGHLGFHRFSAVWTEVVREEFRGLAPEFAEKAQMDFMDIIVAHELGHPPGGQSGDADHTELGIMNAMPKPGDVDFTLKTLKRVRHSRQWYP